MTTENKHTSNLIERVTRLKDKASIYGSSPDGLYEQGYNDAQVLFQSYLEDILMLYDLDKSVTEGN